MRAQSLGDAKMRYCSNGHISAGPVGSMMTLYPVHLFPKYPKLPPPPPSPLATLYQHGVNFRHHHPYHHRYHHHITKHVSI